MVSRLQEVVLHGKLAEDGLLLRQVAHAAPGAQVHRQFRDILARKNHAAFVRAHEPRHHVEGGGFSRAVRPQQAYDLAMAHRQADRVHDGPRFIGFAEAFGSQQMGG